MAQEAYYFSHDDNARNDIKIRAMRKRYGMAGYGRFWVIIENLRTEDGNKLPMQPFVWIALADEFACDEEEAKKYVDDLVNVFDLLKSDGEYFWSESLKRRMDKRDEVREKRAKAGRASARKRAKSQQNSTSVEQNSTSDEQGKERKGKEKKEKEKEREVYTDPTIFFKDEIQKYLTRAIKTKEWLELLDGIDKTIPEIVKDIAQGWVGENREFNPDDGRDRKGVTTFARRWCKNLDREVIEEAEPETEASIRRLDNTPDKIFEIYERLSHRVVSPQSRKTYSPIVRKLLKEGAMSTHRFEQAYPALLKEAPKSKDFDYLFNNFQRLEKIVCNG